MKLVDITCPKCGANLHIDADRKQAFCEYCGAQVIIDDEVQHLQIDNAESAGYAFEKGRQRAQNEAQAQRYYFAQPQPAPKKNKKIVWWVLGWIFIFPIPLTIIIVRNQKLKTAAKIGIIAATWIVYLLIGIASGADNENKDQSKTPAPQTSYSQQTTGGAK
ncbi:MAG: zinc ribbon domain-containing protein [Ruminococcus sp.]|nr:zinc ribbon domain-containing protein [Ruminococcus sp.]